MADALAILSDDERERCRRFMFDRDRRDYALAHAVVRRTLSRHRDDVLPDQWLFTAAPHGKPAIADGVQRRDAAPLAFNLAHTHGLVACAVAEGIEVGVDVEAIDRAVSALEIADRYFAPEEIDALHACAPADRATRFIELWTLKEAYLKAIGTGLSHPLNQFTLTYDGDHGLRFDAPDEDGRAWTFALFAPTALHRMAVAFRSGVGVAPTIETFDEETGATGPRPIRRSRAAEGRGQRA